MSTPFAVGFIGIHSGIYMNVYDITPTGQISLDDINQMIHILRTELLEPLQADCEDFRFRSTMYDLQDMFGEAATVAISNGVAGSSVEMAIRTLACDSQDVIFRAQRDEEQRDNHIILGEEGSVTRLQQLLENNGFM
jgi:hypothetical protein